MVDNLKNISYIRVPVGYFSNLTKIIRVFDVSKIDEDEVIGLRHYSGVFILKHANDIGNLENDKQLKIFIEKKLEEHKGEREQSEVQIMLINKENKKTLQKDVVEDELDICKECKGNWEKILICPHSKIYYYYINGDNRPFIKGTELWNFNISALIPKEQKKELIFKFKIRAPTAHVSKNDQKKNLNKKRSKEESNTKTTSSSSDFETEDEEETQPTKKIKNKKTISS